MNFSKCLFLALTSTFRQQSCRKTRLATYNDMVASSWEPVRPTLTEQQRRILDESSFTHLTDNAAGVINCALLLTLNCIREATAYAEFNGGSTVNNQGRGRDKDEDDEQWWRRCIARSAAMMRPGGKNGREGDKMGNTVIAFPYYLFRALPPFYPADSCQAHACSEKYRWCTSPRSSC